MSFAFQFSHTWSKPIANFGNDFYHGFSVVNSQACEDFMNGVYDVLGIEKSVRLPDEVNDITYGQTYITAALLPFETIRWIMNNLFSEADKEPGVDSMNME